MAIAINHLFFMRRNHYDKCTFYRSAAMFGAFRNLLTDWSISASQNKNIPANFYSRFRYRRLSVDTLAFHAALIFMACLLSYLFLSWAKALKIPVLGSISVWAYGMIIMFAIWGLMCKLKIDYMVDSKIKSKISGAFTDFAVIAAIASLPLKAVAAYIVPILVMVVLGFIVTTGILFFFCKRFLKGYWFEQMIGTLGMATGVFLTGVLLLRICDPELESPALANYSLSYTVTSIIYFAMLNLFIVLPIAHGALVTMMVALGITIAALLFATITSRISFGKEFKGN
ncbi:sodium/glutamate symporter family protein [Faecalispora sporosphaeroides]|uniref:hypothetical protein n=1 Tax=Faecalispora sporosphaeroides TaxID=1549 RepID=UPI002DD68593|nr:hypothetical protein [Faecalispora sporosphaeroides]